MRRRTLTKAAWLAPAVVAVTTAPAVATSTATCHVIRGYRAGASVYVVLTGPADQVRIDGYPAAHCGGWHYRATHRAPRKRMPVTVRVGTWEQTESVRFEERKAK